MTREEAIFTIEHRDGIMDYGETEQLGEALDMAIVALKAEPCEDAVSRQEVLNGLASIAKAKAKSDAQKALMGRVMFFTEQLPPVTPKQRTGKWMPVENDNMEVVGHYCSVCDLPMETEEKSNFCPNCGAKMEGEDDT